MNGVNFDELHRVNNGASGEDTTAFTYDDEIKCCRCGAVNSVEYGKVKGVTVTQNFNQLANPKIGRVSGLLSAPRLISAAPGQTVYSVQRG
ncbi:hypothetical protein SAMN06273570_4871 [Candidatus Pantoea floridensis]|uniref:Uncharacterized protein n=1 Tax=Candidatus Pantoea floridensis TaxID=1938870 RepID=A0A286DQC4_9GAMM|nr:hypothetical protein BX596_4025 [Enterobacteriaceae bacterium JKS000233]SOD60846.1 hypothetical protein SAMN06273570_4871 [Pantoea floridensis]